MKKLTVCLAISAFALTSALQAGDNKTAAPAKPATQASEAKACADTAKDCAAAKACCADEAGTKNKLTKKTVKPAQAKKGATLLAQR